MFNFYATTQKNDYALSRERTLTKARDRKNGIKFSYTYTEKVRQLKKLEEAKTERVRFAECIS